MCARNRSAGTRNPSLTGTTLTLTITGAPIPGVAFFDGAVSPVWNDNSNATYVNWSLDKAGTQDAGNIPGPATDVFLTGSGGPAGSPHAVSLTGAAVTTTLGASFTINSLNFNNVAASNTIAADGSTLTINGTGDSNTDLNGTYTGNIAGTGIRVLGQAGPVTIGVPIILGGTGSQAWINNSANLLTINGSVTGGGSPGVQTLTLSGTGAGGVDITGNISGAGAGTVALLVNNTGGGAATLSGSNSYAGGTVIDAGNLILGSPYALGSPTSSSVAFGPGSPSVLELDGNNVTISDLNTNATAGSPTIENGASGSGTATLTVSTTGVDTYAGALVDSGSGAELALTKAGAGSLTLSGSGAYSGNTTVSAGTLNLSGTLAGSSVFNGATFTESSAGAISGSGAFTNTAGVGTLAGSNTYTGATTVAAGTLNLTGALAGSNVSNGATFAESSAGVITGSGVTFTNTAGGSTLAGANSYTGATAVTSGTLTLSGTLAGSSVSNGATFTESSLGLISGSGVTVTNTSGIITLAAPNTYGGLTTVSGGTLVAANNAALGNSSSPAGGLLLDPASGTAIADFTSATPSIASLSSTGVGTSSVVLGNPAGSGSATTLTVTGSGSGAGTVFAGSISNASSTALGSLTVSGGALTLAGANTYTGPTLITAGALGLTGTLAGSSISNSALFTESSTGVISGGGTFTNVAGNSVLGGSNTYTGLTTLTSGTIQLAANHALGPGNLTVNGGLLDLDGNSVTVGALTGAGGVIDSSTSGAMTLAIGSNGTGGTYSGVIQNSNGVISLVVGSATATATAGTEVIPHAGYTGGTTVNAGSTLTITRNLRFVDQLD